jgi:transposase-like protein
MARGPDTAKQRHWLELMGRWQESRSTIHEFCQRHQLSEASFYSWRRVLRERGLLDESAPAKVSAEAPAFVRLSTVVVGPTGGPIEVVLNERRLLRVRPGFDADVLLELVRLLEEPAC